MPTKQSTSLSLTMPKEGQFVAVWMFGGEIWSMTFKREGNSIYQFDMVQGWIYVCEHDKLFYEGSEVVGFLQKGGQYAVVH